MDHSELSSRLVPLSDGRPGLRGTMPVEVRDPVQSGKDAFHRVPDLVPGEASSTTPDTSCNSCLDFVSSDETLDRCDEIIVASGWKLGSYQRNPVFQNAHQYGDIIFTLGRALITEIRSGPPREAPRGPSTINSQPSTYLFQRIQFATDINPMAKIAYGLYRGKFLNAVSVGFIPLRWENGGDSKAYSRKYLEQELLEVSAVAIPANPSALALGLKSGAVEKADLSDLADLIHQTLDISEGAVVAAVEGGPALASVPGSSTQLQSPSAARYARLMSLARQLHQLLKHS